MLDGALAVAEGPLSIDSPHLTNVDIPLDVSHIVHLSGVSSGHSQKGGRGNGALNDGGEVDHGEGWGWGPDAKG